MELRNLITFIHVVELGSFTRAAELLGYSQSTVSFQIKQLEDELGCLLFERINHTITLTERGRELVSYAHRARALTDELRESAELLEALDNTLASIYAKKTGLKPQTVLDMLKAETWLTAEDAVALGFADEIDEGTAKVAAKVDRRISDRWANAPEDIFEGEEPIPTADEQAAEPVADTDTAPLDEVEAASEDAHERVVVLSSGVARFTDSNE